MVVEGEEEEVVDVRLEGRGCCGGNGECLYGGRILMCGDRGKELGEGVGGGGGRVMVGGYEGGGGWGMWVVREGKLFGGKVKDLEGMGGVIEVGVVGKDFMVSG